MNQVTIGDLEKALASAGISPDEVSARAASIMEDLERYDISEFRLRYSPILQDLIVEYEFGEIGYSVHKARPEVSLISNSPITEEHN